jgi:hypothetical protein
MRWVTKIAAGMVAGLLATAAQASVVYNFVPKKNSGNGIVQVTGGKLVVTDSAYRSGSVNFYYGEGQPDPYSGIDSSRLPDSPISPRVSPILLAEIDVSPAGGVFAQPRHLNPYGEVFPFEASLTFNQYGTLSGQMFIYNVEDELSATGSRYKWDIFNVGSDYFGGEKCGPPTCNAGIGYWRVDPSTIPSMVSNTVPTPPIWSLFGLSLLGIFSLIGLRRKA